MSDEPTNKDLLDYMGGMKEDITVIKEDVQKIDARLQIVENKIDKALFGEIDRHERWIRKIAEKVGVELER